MENKMTYEQAEIEVVTLGEESVIVTSEFETPILTTNKNN